MCLKNLFKKPEAEIIQPAITDNTIYHFAAGDYSGTKNDLPGPQYDQRRMTGMIKSEWDNYVFRKYLDSTTRTRAFLSDLDAAVARIKEGDLLVFISDYCFPGSSTDNTAGIRAFNQSNPVEIVKERFIPGPEILNAKIRSIALRNAGAGNYIAMSACPDWQTALDVKINGDPGGLYHFALVKTARRGITYKEWTDRAGEYIKSLGFDRIPIIEGPESLTSRQIFEGNVHCFILSMHGSWTNDIHGDEADGRDEGPYFPDGLIIDDQINAIISQNPYLI